MKTNIKVGITHGDCNGIGYEVILKALEDDRILEICTPVVYGSETIAAQYTVEGEYQPIKFNRIENASKAEDNSYNLVQVVNTDFKARPGEKSPEAGAAALAALEQATLDLRNGEIDVLVTAPINKEVMQGPDFRFAGHTDYLQARLGENRHQALMILFNDYMRVALATVHIPIADVPAALSTALILERIEQLDKTLQSDFSIVRPRIAVLALNPHSGDNGLMGTEEQELIQPAIEAAQEKKILAFGPYSPDGFFGNALYTKFDGILAMYHDQGLIPLKTLGMENGVNFTAGLPFVRTSPDHGTAFDIAGKNMADGQSMRQAIYSAIDIFRNRERFKQATRNPLRKQYYEKNKSDNVVLDLSKSSDE